MILFKEAGDLQKHLNTQRRKGARIGFVPTMGALHDGHLSLIRKSVSQADITVCSIFVNPTQFNDPADFEKYPVTVAADIRLLTGESTDILFLPSVDEIYPDGSGATRTYELGELETVFEGAHRPGHFQGVCQVVHRLLDIVQPDELFLGQKDYQQCMVLTELVRSFALPSKVVIAETVRGQNGLAMSSRNLRLTPEQRDKASAIFKALSRIKENITTTPIAELERNASAYLLANGFDKVDYISIADAAALRPYTEENWDGNTPLVALAAAFMGDVRLIDNMLL